MKILVKATALTLLITLLSGIASCAEEKKPSENTKSDCPSEVKIGTRYWMTKNLDVTVFRNGESIPEVLTYSKWVEYGAAKKPAWCYYDNNPANGEKYGKLYNWYAVHDSRGLAPVGWRISEENDWQDLENYLAGDYSAARRIMATNDWYSGSFENGGTNTSCFTAYPAGDRNGGGMNGFGNIKQGTTWWVYKDTNSDFVRAKSFHNMGSLTLDFIYFSKNAGFSVRCVRE